MAKKKEENAAAVETEEMKAKFREKLAQLLELGKKKRNASLLFLSAVAVWS